MSIHLELYNSWTSCKMQPVLCATSPAYNLAENIPFDKYVR